MRNSRRAGENGGSARPQEIIRLFGDMKVRSKKLNGEQRLESMYQSLNPFTTQPFLFDWELVKKGYNTKDFIAPASVKFTGKTSLKLTTLTVALHQLTFLLANYLTVLSQTSSITPRVLLL